MSRKRNIPEDLHKVASVAGATAVVAEGAAKAAEKAENMAAKAQELAEEVQGAKKSRKGLVLFLLLAVVGVVAVVVWKRSQGAPGAVDDDVEIRLASVEEQPATA